MSKANCPYCHYPSLEDITPIDLPEEGLFDKADELHHKILQLDETVAQLSRNRAELLEELNEVESSIGVLPQEILSRIFQFVGSSSEFGSFFSKTHCEFIEEDECSSVGRNQVLNKVSANWRRTVMTTPQLWTSLALCIKPTTTESDLYLLRQFLEYSGQLPLTLSIHFSKSRSHRGNLVHPSIDALLVKNLWRIKNLQLNSPRRVWYSHLPQLGQLAHLLLISLRCPPPQVPLSHVPSLSELTLLGLPVIFSSPHITVLNLHAVLPKAILRTVTNCPNLIKLHIRMPNLQMPHDEDDGLPMETLTLQRLEVLEWTLSARFDDPWDIALLSHLHLPSLRALSVIQLRLTYDDEESLGCQAAARFFSRLPTTLASLEICSFAEVSSDGGDKVDFSTLINRDLQDDCQIESIALVYCSFGLVTDIFQGLTHPQRFLQLSRITVDYIWWDREPITLLLRAFLEVVKKRLGVCERPLALNLTRCNPRFSVEWLNCIRSELEELKRRGHEVEIYLESKLVI